MTRTRHRAYIHPSATPSRILAAMIAAERDGRSLTVREIQSACHLSSTSVVTYNLHKLARDGDVEARGKSRGYRVSDQGRGYPCDTELLARCLCCLERDLGAVGGPLLAALRERLKGCKETQ